MGNLDKSEATNSQPQLADNLSFDPYDFVEPCEPDCTPVRHAYHEGQWDMARRINKHFGYGIWPGAVAERNDLLVNSPEADTNVTSDAPRKGVDTE